MSEYPRMMYHEDGRTQTVLDDKQESDASGDGFGRDPHEIHRGGFAVASDRVIQTEPSGQRDFANLVADLVIEKMQGRASNEADIGEVATDDFGNPAPRRRGRPPGSRNALTEG